jgi:hypothetical protein
MQTTNWKDLAELVGFAAIVASLLFVAAQTRQDRIHVSFSTISDIETSLIRVGSLS